MITISQLSKSFGARVLFEDVSLQLNAGSRYGLVGANGSGKTTFLRILAGDEPATDGTVAFGSQARVGVLRQDRFLDDATQRWRLHARGARHFGARGPRHPDRVAPPATRDALRRLQAARPPRAG